MEGAGHLRRLAAAALLCASATLSSCTYASARFRDLGDILRLEGQVGYGLNAHASGGELLHAGVGSSRQWKAGVVYGRAESGTSVEHHLPVTIVQSFIVPEKERAHAIHLGPDGADGTHLCAMIFPGEINPGTVEKRDIHYLDLEAGFLAGIVGIEAGFSIGEAADWILGLFKFSEEWTFLDLAGDDAREDREEKRLWVPRRKKEGYPAPK